MMRDRQTAEEFLCRKTRLSKATAAALPDIVLAKRVLAAGGRRSVSGTTVAVAARKWEIECEARRARR
jgi:hypothetical protein